MALEGTGLLALWNGFDEARAREYDLWHTREHVPERIALPGFRKARRYRRERGPLPEYLTLYELDTPEILASAPYLRLLAEPTPWSASMRPAFVDFLRIGCRIALSAGAGLGSALAARTLAPALPGAPDPHDALRALLREAPITGIHLANRDPTIAPVPFPTGGDAPADAPAGALFLESYDAGELAAHAPALDERLAAAGLETREGAWTIYRLVYAIGRAELRDHVPFPGPDAAAPARRVEHRAAEAYSPHEKHEEAAMVETRELYASSNGDSWLLARDSESGRVFVRHQPNVSSGGRASDMEIGAFLARDARGPEHASLLRLIGTLVERDD